jgi:hypothetical protein
MNTEGQEERRGYMEKSTQKEIRQKKLYSAQETGRNMQRE